MRASRFAQPWTLAADEGRALGRYAAGLRIAWAKREARSPTGLLRRSPALVEPRALSAVRLGGDPMTVSAAFDVAGRRRSPATMPGYHAGRAPRNKGSFIPPTHPPWRSSSR